MGKNKIHKNKKKTFETLKYSIKYPIDWDKKEDERIRKELKKGWAKWTIKYSECKNCKGKISYNFKYDSYYCKSCNKRLESQCGNKECEFCSTRPITPLKI